MDADKSVQQMQTTGARLMQQSSGLPNTMVAPGKAAPKAAAGGGRDEKDMKIADLMRQLDGERDKNRSLEDQYKFRIASFVKRETQTKNKIESLERRLNDGTTHDEHMQRMAVIENMHKSVVSGVECIQNNTAKILQDQERDLMRAFRARLQEVSKEMENQRSKKGEHSDGLQQRHRNTVKELLQAQGLAQTFDKKNQELKALNEKLQEKLKTREDDRQALLSELVSCRKEALRLKALNREGEPAVGSDQAPAAEKVKKSTVTQKQVDQARAQSTQNKQYEREVKYREAIVRLKRMVETERKQSKALRQQQAEILQQRTELEVLLRQCLDDVKSEIMRRRLEHTRTDGPELPHPGQSVAAMSVNELTPQDRERVLELLLSQQRVVQLLYSRAFPEGGMPVTEDPAASKTSKEDDFAWLSDIMPGES